MPVGVEPKLASHSRRTDITSDNIVMQTNENVWTDDLPVCELSGVGLSTNLIYRKDGVRHEEHEFEDRSFHFKVNKDTGLYGVFDGHEGCRASDFAAQRMPAEIVLGQLEGKHTDEEIKEVLRQAFIAVEEGFFETIDDALTERVKLKMEFPEGMSYYDLCKHYPNEVKRLEELHRLVCGGTTACVALIHKNKLYVANVGDSRALLCKLDSSGQLRVVQLSVDHGLKNEDELFRLQQLGVDVEKLLQCHRVGNQENTRSIGDYMLKSGYRDVDTLSASREEPVIAEPEIHGGIPLDESCCFLMLMTDGLYNTLIEATGTDRVNADIAGMVAGEFAVQSTLLGVAQAVVDKILRIHHDTWFTGSERASLCTKRDDITLLVRNINYQLSSSVSQTNTLYDNLYPTNASQTQGTYNNDEPYTGVGMHQSCTMASTESSTGGLQSIEHSSSILPLDENNRIKPYVSFSDFFKKFDAVGQQDELDRLLNALTVKHGEDCANSATAEEVCTEATSHTDTDSNQQSCNSSE